MDLEGGSAAEFPCLEYKCGGDSTEVFESLCEQSDGLRERHGLILVLALAVSAKEAMRLVVQAPFQRSSRCGLLVRPVRRALQR